MRFITIARDLCVFQNDLMCSTILLLANYNNVSLMNNDLLDSDLRSRRLSILSTDEVWVVVDDSPLSSLLHDLSLLKGNFDRFSILLTSKNQEMFLLVVDLLDLEVMLWWESMLTPKKSVTLVDDFRL